MAKSSKKGNYKSVVKKENSVNVSELNYSDREIYIQENYAPFISDAQMIFSIWESGLEYNYVGDTKKVVKEIIDHYESLGDYTEKTLPEETIYEIQDWELVRKDIDPETDEKIGETPLEEISADNTYNFSYLGLVHLNWRVFYDAEYERYFYVITPHLGGDIRGNYGEAIILEGNDKEDLFYRFFEGFVSGSVSIYLKFADGSEVGFDSEQDSDTFTFRVSEQFEPTGIAEKFVADFEKFDSSYGDEFLEETVNIFLARKGIIPKMMAGGRLDDETPQAYIEILGYNEGEWVDLTQFSDGDDVIDYIENWMSSLNKELGGNREEYRVADYEGFGNDMYDEYMGANEFTEIIEAYEKFQQTDFPSAVIEEYRKDIGSSQDTLSEIIDRMDNNFLGKYSSYSDFGYAMVEDRVYNPTLNDVYITDTDKRIIAGEESDRIVSDMSFEELLENAENTEKSYQNEILRLQENIAELESEIDDLENLQSTADTQEDYERIADEIEEKQSEIDEIKEELDDIDSRFEDSALREAESNIYDEIYDKLENDLGSWLDEMGYSDENLSDLRFLSIDYEAVGEEVSSDYLTVEFDGEIYFFQNYGKGGRLKASKLKPKFNYYIVENSTKKLVSGYGSKQEALEQRKLLIEKYPSMRFEIFTLGNLESKTDLDVYSKSDYVELSTLDKIKKVSIDAYRYGKDKVGQVNAFLKKHDVKGKIKRGSRDVWEKTKQGGNWLKRQWEEADFGDGKGKAKFFADGGGVDDEVRYIHEDSNKSGLEIDTYYVIERNGYKDYNSIWKYLGKLDRYNVPYRFKVSLKRGDGTYSNPFISDMPIGVKYSYNLVPLGSDKREMDIIHSIRETESKMSKNISTFADGGGVDVSKMTYDEMKIYEKGKYIHYNPMNSRWQVWNNGNVEEFWNQEQAEKYAGYEYNQDQDARYSRKRYEALFGYADGGGVDFMARGGAIKQNEGKLFNEKGEMLVYKKQSETSSIYDVDVYEPRKTDVEEYSKFKYCKREKNGRECVYRLDKKALLEMIKKEKFIYAKGGGIYMTSGEYRNKLEEMSVDELKKEIEYEMGIDVSLQEVEDEFNYYVNELVSNYRMVMGSRGQRFAEGGMAQLGDVAGMLPSPLPMSVIQPMAKGGYVGFKVRSKNLRGGYNNYIITGYNEMYKKYTLKDVKTNVTTTATEKELKDIYEFVDEFAVGGNTEEIAYLDRRIKNLEELAQRVNPDEADEVYQSISGLKQERSNLINNPSGSKKSFWFFKEGGDVEKLKKLEEKVDIVEDEIEKKIEQLTGKKEEEEEENENQQYDVYDNKRMLENQAHEVQHHSEELNNQVPKTQKVPAWVIAKMERATTDLSDITHYLDGENKMAHGGSIGSLNYQIVPIPNSSKFAVFTSVSKNDKKFPYRNFDGSIMEFEDLKSADKFAKNVLLKHPFGTPKANVGAYLLASQMLQQKQQQTQQPQVVYYVPQEQKSDEGEIIQNMPEMAHGGVLNNKDLNDFCIREIIELAKDFQSVHYYTTTRNTNKGDSDKYKGKLIIVFKEQVELRTIDKINEFIRRAEGCQDIFDDEAIATNDNQKSVLINLRTDNFTDYEFKKGGKVYEQTPKKIDLEKTKIITTVLGDYILGLVTTDFVYFVNPNEGDENAQTIMYNKKGELLSDNIHATNDLTSVLETENNFEFIHPDLEMYRQEMIKENKSSDGFKVFNYTDNVYATDEVFINKSDANKFISEFRKRYENQGYYRDNRMNKISPSEIDLLAIPKEFNPYRN